VVQRNLTVKFCCRKGLFCRLLYDTIQPCTNVPQQHYSPCLYYHNTLTHNGHFQHNLHASRLGFSLSHYTASRCQIMNYYYLLPLSWPQVTTVGSKITQLDQCIFYSRSCMQMMSWCYSYTHTFTVQCFNTQAPCCSTWLSWMLENHDL